MARLGVLFDIDQLIGGLYGRAAFEIFFTAVDTRQLAGCALSCGDTGAIFPERAVPYCFCIAVEAPEALPTALVKEALSRSGARGLMPLTHRFLEDVQLVGQALMPVGRIDAAGELAGCDTPWIVAAWQESREMRAALPAQEAWPGVTGAAITATEPAAGAPGGASDIIYCYACGYPNPAWRQQCERCRTVLRPVAAPQRPGCVSVYAILLFVGAAFLALGSLGYLPSPAGMILLGLAVFQFSIARGLWQLRNWARVTIIVTQGLGLAVSVLGLVTSLGSDEPPMSIILTLVSIGVAAWVVGWFGSHRDCFS